MSDVIGDYKRWKQQGEDLRAKAKAAIESRFRELLSEAMQLSEEYRADFGSQLKPPAAITAFRYKAGKPKGRPAGKTAAPPAVPVVAPAAPTKKMAALQRRLETAKKKLEAAKAGGQPTRDLDDKIYEIEDALRLAEQGD